MLALLICGGMATGYFGLATPIFDPLKIGIPRAHMAGGMLVFALMAVRIIVRMRASKPDGAAAGSPLLGRTGQISYCSSYILVLRMAGASLATAIPRGLNKLVFGGSSAPLPPALTMDSTRVAHGYLAALLGGFIILHVFAVFYHPFVRKDGRLGRMLLLRGDTAPGTL